MDDHLYDTVRFVALTPLWMRLLAWYVLAGLALSHYGQLRTAGESVAASIGGTLAAAFMAPATAIAMLISKWTAPKL